MNLKDHLKLPLSNCSKCPLYNKETYNPYNATGNFINPRFLFIGEAPGGEEANTGKVFQGRAGQLIRYELSQLGIKIDSIDKPIPSEEEECAMVNVVCCRPTEENGKNRKPSTKEIKYCSDNFNAILNYFKDKVEIIVPMGGSPLKALTGKSKITQFKGTLIENHLGKIYPIFHPAYILRNPSLTNTWRGDIKQLLDIVNNKKTKIVSKDYKIITDLHSFVKFYNTIIRQKSIAIDTEGTGLNWRTDKIIGISFSWAVYQGCYIPIYTQFPEESPFITEEVKPITVIKTKKKSKKLLTREIVLYPFWGVNQEYVLEKIKEIVTNPDFKVAGANYKYDHMMMFTNWGVNETNFKIDVNIIDYLLDENQFHSLKEQANRRYEDMRNYDSELKACLTPDDLEEEQYSDVSLEILGKYGCMDADVTFRIAGDGLNELKKRPKLLKLYKDLYLPMHFNYAEGDLRGVYADSEHTKKIIEKYEKEVGEIANDIYEEVGYEFNIGSPKQLGIAIFEKLGLPNQGLTASGQYKTDKEVLNSLGQKNPTVAKAVDYKNRLKMISTYLKPVLDYIDDNNRIYFCSNLHGAKTGRTCLTGDTEILTEDGKVEIVNLIGTTEPGEHKVCFKVQTLKGVKEVDTAFVYSPGEVWKIELEDGTTITGTPDHQLIIEGKKVKFSELSEGDYVEKILNK